MLSSLNYKETELYMEFIIQRLEKLSWVVAMRRARSSRNDTLFGLTQCCCDAFREQLRGNCGVFGVAFKPRRVLLSIYFTPIVVMRSFTLRSVLRVLIFSSLVHGSGHEGIM